MAPRTSRRRLSLDLFQKTLSDISSEGGIAKYMDLKLPSHSSSNADVSEVECECCGLSENYTGAYVRRVRDRFCGRWVCGLCSEAVQGELEKLGLATHHVIREEALRAHMEVCKKFNRTVRVNPALSLAGAMAEILKKSSQRRGDAVRSKKSKVLRSCSTLPTSHGA